MEEKVIKVKFFKPIDGQTEFYFGSLKAIYERFTSEQIGCSIYTLWNAKISLENPKATSKCVITKHTVVRQTQNKSGNGS